MYELFAPLDRLAPGSADTTLRALSLVPEFDTRSRVIELGCGTGTTSVLLASVLPGTLVAVDRHAPFVARLRDLVAALGLDHRLDARVADMRDAGVEPGSMDLIWAEGSLYTIGWDKGLALCRRLLAPGGVLAVSELAWIDERPSERARAYWAEHYPQMRTRAELLSNMQAQFVVHGEFVQPQSDWTGFYERLRERAAEFGERSDAAAHEVVEIVEREIEIHERCGHEYGYVFVVASART